MAKSGTHHSNLLIFAASAWVSTAPFAAAQSSSSDNFGTDVVNVAKVSYTVDGDTITVMTGEAVFTIRPPATPAVIEFLRYSDTAADPIVRTIHGTDYSPSGELDGPYVSIGSPVTTGGQVLDLSSPIPLIPASTYLAGELMFVRVTDTGQNLDSNIIDTLNVAITSDTGDEIVLRLYESGPNTGEFLAYLPSTPTPTPAHDRLFTASQNTSLRATYIDVFDSTDVTVDTAILNPLNRVFNSVTGDAVDGAVITLLNHDTGEEAAVYGVDGFSTFPPTVISGQDIIDSSGQLYDNSAGGFQFPVVEPGNYAIRVDPPEGYSFGSVLQSDTSLQKDDQGFVLLPISFGEVLNLGQGGPLRFDIPLDPVSDIVIQKDVDRNFGDVGDYVNYTVTVENRGRSTSIARLYDTLPLGFRYVPGTARIAQQSANDPNVSDDASLLTFDMGVLEPGESVQFDYALQIGPGAVFGDAVNRAVIRDGNQQAISNVARAGITLREDLLRSTSTIVGRVSEKSCDENADWVRPIGRGAGVSGVRLYMETGAYVVTDTDGLFHFEGVSEGTHVVQVDRETLPKGFALMTCEDNTRYAGTNSSMFVDVQGGGIWRANFYLKQVGKAAEKVEEKTFNDSTEYLDYDTAWLSQQTSDIAWVYPETTRTPSSSSTNIGIKHGAGQRLSLTVNDRDVPAYLYAGRERSDNGKVMLSRWRGVNLEDGRNVVIATVKDKNGQVVKTLREEIWYVKTIARAVAVPEKSKLIADGRTVPEIAIRMEDQSGRPVHAGRITTVNLKPPYRLYDENGNNRLLEETEELVAPLSARQDLSVGADGVLKVRLEPTLRTGKVTVIATLDNGREVPIYMYLEPEKRDWILVGLAEGTAGYNDVKGNMTAIEASGGAEDIITDGRVAFFAKGMVKGNWLMTLGVDTDRKRRDRDGAFRDEIDPNAYYTLYGDRSYQEFEGNSRYPLYLKLEKRQAYAMFGDYETNVTEGRLTSYNRRLTGLKAEYLGDKIQVLGFAAETNQGFAKDELAADGTSGTYQLSNAKLLAQSEEVVIETRDRFRPDVILERKVLVRYLDYTLDYLTGQLIFRLPVEASDAEFNPNVIVVDYETSEDVERNVTFGGRVQTQILKDKVQIGSTFVREDGSALAAGSEQIQVGVDVIADVSDKTQIRAEYAMTENKSLPDSEVSTAKLLEVIHNAEKLAGEVYFRQEDAGYGLNQRGSTTNAARRYGLRGSYKLSEFEDEDTGRRGYARVEGQAFREENLTTGDVRSTGEVVTSYEGTNLGLSAGLRVNRDELVSAEDRESALAILRGSYKLPKHDVTLQVSHEQPLGGKDEVSAYPQRTTIGFDKGLGQKATISLRHELLNGADTKANNTTLGITATAWKGGSLTANADMVTNDSGRRIGATVGLDQTVRVNDNWSVTAGLRRRNILESDAEYQEVLPDAAISPLEVNEDFSSAYLGAGYSDKSMSGSVRGEFRDSSASTAYIGSASVARELSETLSIAGTARGLITEPKTGSTGSSPSTSQLDMRVGAAWRPRDEDAIIFNRLDLSHTHDANGQRTTKIVNNAAINLMIKDRMQVSANWGVKNVRNEVAGQQLENWSNLVGFETRFDVSENIDLGFKGSVMMSSDAGKARAYSWGPSIGVSPMKNVWLSAGYNVDGFADDDFAAAEYSRKGPYLQMRFKFDENTAKGLLRKISPASLSGARP